MGWHAVPCDAPYCVDGFCDQHVICKKCSGSGRILVRDIDPYRDLAIARVINFVVFALVCAAVFWGAIEIVLKLRR
jgi:hypothetical protein